MIVGSNHDDYLSSPYDYEDEGGLIGECEVCGRQIYAEEPHYKHDGAYICDRSECLRDYVESLGWYEYGVNL